MTSEKWLSLWLGWLQWRFRKMDGFKLFTRVEQIRVADEMNMRVRESKEWRKITPRLFTWAIKWIIVSNKEWNWFERYQLLFYICKIWHAFRYANGNIKFVVKNVCWKPMCNVDNKYKFVAISMEIVLKPWY